MKNRISFCVNACKKNTFRFIGGLQNVLRFLFLTMNLHSGLNVFDFSSAANNPCPYTSSLFLYIIRCIYYLLIILVKLLVLLVE